MTTIGVISDTHGLLRPEALAELQGSNLIVHAGDIGDPAILDKLNEIAPVTAVRGNVDKGVWAQKIPQTNVLEVEGVSIYVLHILDELDLCVSIRKLVVQKGRIEGEIMELTM